MRLLDDVTASAAERHPDDLALAFGTERTTFAQLDARVTALARGLARLAEPGQRVAVVAENHPAWVDCYYGVPRAGLVLALLNHRLGPGPLRDSIAAARPQVLVAGRAQLDALAAHGPGSLADLAPVVVVVGDEGGAPPPGATPWADLVGGGGSPGGGGTGSRAGRRPGGTAWLIPTSGTSGTPKWVQLSHANLLAAVATTAAARPTWPAGPYLFPFPLCHVAGYNVVLAHAHGQPVVLLPRFEPAAFARAADEHRAATASLAPTMVHGLVEHLAATGRRLGSLRAVAYGASPIAPDLLARAQAVLDVDLHQGYGMTELAGNAVFLGPDDHRRALAGRPDLLSAAGRPGPGVEVRLVGEGGGPVPAGAVGEIEVRAAQVMAGYWDPGGGAGGGALPGRPGVGADGWFATGDVGRWDDEGLLHVVDRKKDVIVTGGENVASRQVEDQLAAHPGIAEVAVVGAPDERWGEVVCAVVVPRPGSGLTEAEVLAHGRAAIGGYQQPRRVVLVGALPRTASGKVRKAELRSLVAGGGAGG